MKKLLSLLLIALLILNFAACGKKQSGKPDDDDTPKEETIAQSPEEDAQEEPEEEEPELTITQQLAKDCVDAMFVPDMRAIFDLANDKLMAYARAQKHTTDAQYDAIIAACDAAMQSSIDELNALCDDWQIEIKFLSQEPFGDRRLSILRHQYSQAGINLSGGTLMKVRIYAVIDGAWIPLQDTTFSFAQVLGRWYLDPVFTELIPKPEESDGPLPTA